MRSLTARNESLEKNGLSSVSTLVLTPNLTPNYVN